MFNKKTVYYYVTYVFNMEDRGLGYGATCLENSVTGFLAIFANTDLLIRDARNIIEEKYRNEGKKIEIVITNWKVIKKNQYLEFEAKS